LDGNERKKEKNYLSSRKFTIRPIGAYQYFLKKMRRRGKQLKNGKSRAKDRKKKAYGDVQAKNVRGTPDDGTAI